MKKAIILVKVAAAAVAGAMTSADVDNNVGEPQNLAASFKCEKVFPALGFDYVFAGRVALGPVAKYDGESYAAGLASRIYLLGDSRAVGINPYIAAEGDTSTARRRLGSKVGGLTASIGLIPNTTPKPTTTATASSAGALTCARRSSAWCLLWK